MSNPLALATIKSGLISKEQLDELKRWGAPIEVPQEVPNPPSTVEEAASILEEALVSQGFVLTKETDLEVLAHYMRTQQGGMLHVEIEEDPSDVDTLISPIQSSADISVIYGKTPLGEYILPYRGENISKEMTNGRTHLLAEGKRIFFKEARDCFYGDVKAFMICTVSITENNDG